jgi:ATP-dependent helicase/nuclease subunit B
MAGWIHLHPVSRSGLGMGWEDTYGDSDEAVVYVLPGTRLVRRMIERHGESGVKFMTFDQFVRWCLGPSHRRPLMTRDQQRLLIEQALWELDAEFSPLTVLDKAIQRPSRWADALEGALGELKRSGITPGRLRELWKGKPAKYQELAMFYEVYQKLLNHHQLWDQEEPYFELSRRLLERSAGIRRPGRLVLEHFHDLNPLQEQLLTSLVTVTEIHFHVMYDETRELLRSMAKPIVGRLQYRGFQVVLENRKPGRNAGKSASLVHLTEQAFSERPAIMPANGAVEVIKAPGTEAEADAVVTRLKIWLRETAADCSDVAIIVPSLKEYGPALFKRLDKAGIPVRTGSRLPLFSHPMFQTVVAAFQVRFEQEDSLSMLVQSSHLSWSEEAEKLRELLFDRTYPKTPGELRQAWGDFWRDLERQAEDPDPIIREEAEKRKQEWKPAGRAVDSICAWIEEIPETMEWNEWIHWFEEWIGPLKNKERWKHLARDPKRLKEVAEEIAVWNELQELVRRWKEMKPHGRSPVLDGVRFLALLADSAKECFVPVRPGGRRGVQILEAPKVRGDRFRAVFMMGCADGIWPRMHIDFWLLPDRERRRLRDEEIHLVLSGEHRNRERIEFFMSLASAEELLVFSCPTLDREGKKLIPSPYLEECLQTLDDVREKKIDVSEQAGPVTWEAAYSLEKAAEYAISCLAKPDAKPVEMVRAGAVVEAWKKDQPWRWRLLLDQAGVQRARFSPDWTPFDGMIRMEGTLGERLGARLQMHDWRAKELDILLSCRFRFLSESIWHLVREEAGHPDGSTTLGGWLHQVMSGFWNEHRQNPGNWIIEERGWERLARIAHDKVEEWLRTHGRGQDPLRIRIARRKLLNKLREFWEHEREWREEKKFFDPPEIDVEYELDLALSGETQRTIRLRGQIDRVDVDQEGFYAVYDYKIRESSTKQEIKEGRKLRLYVDLWGYRQRSGADPAYETGAAYWLPKDRNKGLWRGELARKWGITGDVLNDQEWTEVQEGAKQAVSQQLERALSGDFAVQPATVCPDYCRHRKICRFDPRRMHAQRETPEKEGD